MRFVISRTSLWVEEEPPCDDAIKVDVVRIDERTADDPAKIGSSKGNRGWWFEEGRNHRVEKGRIRRDFDDTAWVVDIKSFDDLMAFCREHGTLVLSAESINTYGMPGIEIYDDYRE
jgi:hypothetical protein